MGFKIGSSRSQGTFTSYTSLDDKLDELYYYMQYIKFGFGRCTSEASIDIRDNYISRKEGISLDRLKMFRILRSLGSRGNLGKSNLSLFK